MDPERVKLLLELLEEYHDELEPHEYKQITVQALVDDLRDRTKE